MKKPIKEQSCNMDFLDVVKHNLGAEIDIFEDFTESYESRKRNELLYFKVKKVAKEYLSHINYGIFFKYFFQHWTQELISEFYEISQPAVSKRIKKSKKLVVVKMRKWEFLLA